MRPHVFLKRKLYIKGVIWDLLQLWRVSTPVTPWSATVREPCADGSNIARQHTLQHTSSSGTPLQHLAPAGSPCDPALLPIAISIGVSSHDKMHA